MFCLFVASEQKFSRWCDRISFHLMQQILFIEGWSFWLLCWGGAFEVIEGYCR